MSNSRIYIVTEHNTTTRRLIEATTSAQAIRHCVRQKFEAKPATPKEIAALMVNGAHVERATDDSLIPNATAATNKTNATTTTKEQVQ